MTLDSPHLLKTILAVMKPKDLPPSSKHPVIDVPSTSSNNFTSWQCLYDLFS